MSKAVPPLAKEIDTLQSTRQMLDELDALMDRMLAIPVNDVDDPAPRPGDIVRMPTVSATLTVLEAPLEDEEDPAKDERPAQEARPLLQESFPSYSTETVDTAAEPAREPLLLQPHHLEAPPKAPEPEPIPEDTIPPAITALPVPAVESTPIVTLVRPRQRSLVSRGTTPVLWLNQTFDKGTTFLGERGQWLRSPSGRRVLGLAGVTLLAAAALWLVIDWLGWTW
jgi:hypothetical protein